MYSNNYLIQYIVFEDSDRMTYRLKSLCAHYVLHLLTLQQQPHPPTTSVTGIWGLEVSISMIR